MLFVRKLRVVIACKDFKYVIRFEGVRDLVRSDWKYSTKFQRIKCCVTRSVDTEYDQLSPQEQKTVDAIVEESKLPLSTVLVGVGDGPWDTMKEFDDNITDRDFDNFQVKVLTWMGNNEKEEFVSVGARFGPILETKEKDANKIRVALSDKLTGEVILMHRGNCSFTVKAHVAELAGASAILIIRNQTCVVD